MELLSPRLRLRQASPAEMRVLLDGGAPEGQQWESGYPLDATFVFMAMQVEHERESRFGLYQILRREDGTVIGDIGFHAPPDALGEAGFGFGVVPGARRRGFATEAVRTFLGWALQQPEIRSLRAESDAGNVVAHRTLMRAGMRAIPGHGDRRAFEIWAP